MRESNAPAENRAAQEDRVFKALADPTRREILDQLRGGAATTGSVAAGFGLSRYGVMKHLRVLQDAGLVLVEPRGRERWNYVNPLPIQSIYRRWIRPFEEEPSDRLLRLQRLVEGNAPLGGGEKEPGKKEDAVSQDISKVEEFGVIDLVSEVTVAADAPRVWKALTEETGSWWHPAFYTIPAPHLFRIETEVGGRMFEDGSDGQGLLWGTVIGLQTNSLLQVANDTSRQWGGPSRGIMTWRLESVDGRTKLRFEQTQYGVVSETTRASLQSGWDFLFGRCLKPWIESGQDPASVPFEEPES
ncbi:MAG: metalloregulator ArsR/SmtB family transcription factor [Thermoanaerobaculia bacterium]|nr:metalloregulator ArsR/SmtB family transcription factor [Thermoanaerobaculia bacterium]